MKDEKELLKQAQDGIMEARDLIIEKYWDYVKAINYKYGNSDDGFQEGILGLMKAIEKYNFDYKGKFSSYAYYWIRKYILNFNQKNYYNSNSYIISLYRELIKYNGMKTDFYKEKKLKAETIKLLNNIDNINNTVENFEIEDNNTVLELESFFNKDYLENLMKKCLNKSEIFLLKQIYLSDSFKIKKNFSPDLMLIKNQALNKIKNYIYENHLDRKKPRYLINLFRRRKNV